jgi:hypothetical protein
MIDTLQYILASSLRVLGMDLLITDVTEMGGGTYCVAGWDVNAKRMARPLPNGSNWSSQLLGQHGIVAGKMIRAEPKGTPSGIFPHRTEDAPIDPASIKSSNGVFSDWLGASAPVVAADLETGFADQLKWNKIWNEVRQGVHTLPRAKCASLTSVQVPRANLVLSEPFESLKATLNDGAASYQLTVSSKVLKEAWRAGGLSAVTDALPARDIFHVRVGLARPFGDPLKCYAMLNGAL